MITKKSFTTAFVGASSMHSNVMLLGVKMEEVIKELNKLNIYEGCVFGGTEVVENNNDIKTRVVSFTVFGEMPDIVYNLTKSLNCKGYADTAWDSYIFICAENGKDCDTFTAYWDPFMARDDGYFDAFVNVIDTPTGVMFMTGAGAIDGETVEYYADIVKKHPADMIIPKKTTFRGVKDSYKVSQIDKILNASDFYAYLSGDRKTSGANTINLDGKVLELIKAFYEGKTLTVEEETAC